MMQRQDQDQGACIVCGDLTDTQAMARWVHGDCYHALGSDAFAVKVRAYLPAPNIEGLGIERLLLLRVQIAAEIKARKEGRTRSKLDKANSLMAARSVKATLKIMDKRRLIVGPVPGNRPHVMPGLDGSAHPDMVRDPGPGETVLKDGRNVQKLGGDVLVGELKGARLFSVALEERATCPRSCGFWDNCYTNGMHRLIRYRHGPALEAKIAEEVADLCKAHEKVLVRLHMSGDFYSSDYLHLWGRLISKHYPKLYVFGFTAHEEGTPLGDEIASYRLLHRDRFAVRTSGRTGKWGSFTVPLMAEDRAMIGDAVVCPEQRDAMKGFTNFTHCGSCGLCWKSDAKSEGRPIVFYDH